MSNPYNPTENYDQSIDDYSTIYLYYPDDEKYFAEMLKSEWSLKGPMDENPHIYFDTSKNSTRNNAQGGSIFVYRASFQFPRVVGINYDASSMSSAMCIDIQTPKNRERHMAWVREAIRILHLFRRAGRSRLNGWDYLEVTSVNPRSQNYNNFFQTAIDFKLTRAVSGIDTDGFGHEVRMKENE